MRSTALLLLLGVLSVSSGQDYFAELNIDATLISQTKLALTTLKNSLYLNFDCSPQQFTPPAFSDPTAAPLFQGYQHYEFEGISGFPAGYNGASPQVSCQNGRQRGAVLFALYQQVVTVTTLLQTIKSYLWQYNNVVLGGNNTVVGDNNFVMGSNNNLLGSNDWVFASNYESTDPQNGVLVIELYLIELAKVPMIANNPAQAIHCVDQAESNRQFSNFWKQVPSNRRFTF